MKIRKFKLFSYTHLSILAVIFIHLLVFSPSIKGDFIWDDNYIIANNSFMQSSSFIKKFLFTPFGVINNYVETKTGVNDNTQYYRPFSMLSFWIDYKIWGLNPSGFHITNLVIHILNSLLLLFILKALGFSQIISFISAILFAVYPLHFENVSWISGRTDLLSFFFAALAILFFFKNEQRKERKFLIFSCLFYLFSLLCKENFILLWLILLIFLLVKGFSFKTGLKRSFPYFLCFIFWIILRMAVISTRIDLSLSFRAIWQAIGVVGFYSFKLIFPFNLSISVNTRTIFSNILYPLFGLIILVLLILLSVLLIKKNGKGKKAYAAVIFIYLFILPSLFLVFYPNAKSIVAWRFLYAASAIFIGLSVYFLSRIIKYKRLLYFLFIFTGIVYSLELIPKTNHYALPEKDFWIKLKDIQEENLLIQLNAATELIFIDEAKALKIYRHILDNRQDHPKFINIKVLIYENLAAYYSIKKDRARALIYYKNLLKMKRASIKIMFNYATFLYSLGEIKKSQSIVTDILINYSHKHTVLVMAANYYIFIKGYKSAIGLLLKDYELFGSEHSLTIARQLQAKEEKRNQ